MNEKRCNAISGDDRKTVMEALCLQGFSTLRPPEGKLRFPYLEPGSNYGHTLWDWDSYWTARGLASLCRIAGGLGLSVPGSENLAAAARGNVCNFLDLIEEDGWIPVMIRAMEENDDYCRRPNVMNTHKPFLCQSALQACELSGDENWLDLGKLERYLDYYRSNQYHEPTGLYVWKDDVMVGGDNNPTVFGRPNESCADVYLNASLAAEFGAMEQLCRRRDLDGSVWAERKRELTENMNAYMWDEADGLFYSQDVQVETHRGPVFHRGVGAFWKCMPLKVKIWSCFLPMTFGLASPEQGLRMIEAFERSSLGAPFGVRTMAREERMYNLEPSGNPSNWLGAIWGVANYALFSGFLRYGRRDLAERICDGEFKCFAEGIRRHGCLFESYHPDTGEPFLNPGFLSWNLLAAAMLEELEVGRV